MGNDHSRLISMNHPPYSSQLPSGTIHSADRPLARQGFQESLADRGAYRPNVFPSPQVRCLSMGAALLGCALACIQDTAAQASNLATGTISNFSVTATSGSTTGSYTVSGPTGYFLAPLNITLGGGSGYALAGSLGGYFDVVGFTLDDTVANVTGGGSGSFTMNFTASVLFYDLADLVGPGAAESTTAWTVTGLGSIPNGQSFAPGSYTFNFTTTHVLSSTNILGVAVFVVPEVQMSGLPFWAGGLLLVAGSLRARRSKKRDPLTTPATDQPDTLPAG